MIDARFYSLDNAQGYVVDLPLSAMARLDLEPGQRGTVVYSNDVPVGILVVADTADADKA